MCDKLDTSNKDMSPGVRDWSSEIEELTSYPFPCPNCDQAANEPTLFCSILCKQEASFVRYARRCNEDGRCWDPDVEEAIKIKMASILGGGYPEDLRRIPDTVRQEAVERDGGRCVECGSAGTDVDHIHGSSCDLANLQLLCRSCHNAKTVSGLQPISPETHPEEYAKAMSLMARVDADKPIRVCDSKEWEGLWRTIHNAKKKRML